MKSLTDYIYESNQKDLREELFFAITGEDVNEKAKNKSKYLYSKDNFLYNSLDTWLWDEDYANINNLNQIKVMYYYDPDDCDEEYYEEIKEKSKNIPNVELEKDFDKFHKLGDRITKDAKLDDRYESDMEGGDNFYDERYFYAAYWDVIIKKI